ncbi:MAG: CarD family transcriptional regulator [Akkermansia sp.]
MRRELAERQIRNGWTGNGMSACSSPIKGGRTLPGHCAGTPACCPSPLFARTSGRVQHPGSENGRPLFLGTVRQVPVRYGGRRAAGRQGAQGTRAGIPERLNPGDLVVHTSYGIGKFINISPP